MHARIALSAAVAAILAATAAHATPFPAPGAQSATTVVAVAKKRQAQRKDCTPYNGPYGFYGNVWCQPPSEQSYLRNLSSPWPQETPPALKKAKPHDTGSDW